jgi:hypothetical protein
MDGRDIKETKKSRLMAVVVRIFSGKDNGVSYNDQGQRVDGPNSHLVTSMLSNWVVPRINGAS